MCLCLAVKYARVLFQGMEQYFRQNFVIFDRSVLMLMALAKKKYNNKTPGQVSVDTLELTA
jgi:hypothetical protein